MKKILLLILFMCLSRITYSQSFFVKSGKNFTNYKYKSSLLATPVKLNSDSGNYYEIGAAFPLGFSKGFTYEVGLVLNELNSIVGSPSKVVSYKTEYLGVDNAVLYSLIKSRYFVLDAKAGLGLHTIVYGREEIDGVFHDLKRHTEFNGMFFKASLGVQSKFYASKDISLSIGYDYHYDVFNTNNDGGQSLFINNSQIKMGIYLTIDKNRNKPTLLEDNGVNISEENETFSKRDVTSRNTKRVSTGSSTIEDLQTRNNSKVNAAIDVREDLLPKTNNRFKGADKYSADLNSRNKNIVVTGDETRSVLASRDVKLIKNVDNTRAYLAPTINDKANIVDSTKSNVASTNKDKVNTVVNTRADVVPINSNKINYDDNKRPDLVATNNNRIISNNNVKEELLEKNINNRISVGNGTKSIQSKISKNTNSVVESIDSNSVSNKDKNIIELILNKLNIIENKINKLERNAKK